MDHNEELNARLADRNIPSAPLQPQFSIRPVSTKYAMMPLFDRRPKPTVPIVAEPTYSVEKVFNPGSAQAPWSGFASNINEESSLRNQFFALQSLQRRSSMLSTQTSAKRVANFGATIHGSSLRTGA